MAQIKNTSVSHAFSIYLFIYSNIFIQDKNIGYFAYVPCFMTSICIKSENTYLNNNYHIMYNS